MREVLENAIQILSDSAPYLLLGFALAGVLHVILGRFPGMTAPLTRGGRRSVFFGALIGLPMPLCSCSVLPAAMALRRDGASKGATASFLVSVPETDVVSIFVTYALIGPVMAVYRPIAAVAAALTTGLAVEATQTAPAPEANPPLASCHCDEASAPAKTGAPWWKRALHYGFVDIFDDIVGRLLVGIALAAVIGAWLPDIDGAALGGGRWLEYLAMAAIGVPLYVCATASTPIAAGFIAGGISPGAAMVFLLAGPATNMASLVVLRAEFGWRFVTTYVTSIGLGSIALGALLDALVGGLSLPPLTSTVHAHESLSPWRVALVGAFLLMALASIRRTRAVQRTASMLRNLPSRMAAR